jgi:hypothetical protein
MQRAIDYAFDITDATHPKLRLTGSLRPMVEQCWASLLLHYKEMHSEGELPGAIAKMRKALVMAGIATNAHLAHTVLVLYSDQIRAQLQRDQFADGCTATTHGSEPSMYTQVATVLQNLVQRLVLRAGRSARACADRAGRPGRGAPRSPSHPPAIASHSPPNNRPMDQPARFARIGAGDRRGHRGAPPRRTPSLVAVRHNTTAATLQSMTSL